MPKAGMRALAGWLVKQGHCGAATMIVVAFHHILRSNEFKAIVGADVIVESEHFLVFVRDTEFGQRLSINQEFTIKSKWLRQRVLNARNATTPGFPLLGRLPQTFQKLWMTALRATRVPSSYTPCSLRRGKPTG